MPNEEETPAPPRVVDKRGKNKVKEAAPEPTPEQEEVARPEGMSEQEIQELIARQAEGLDTEENPYTGAGMRTGGGEGEETPEPELQVLQTMFYVLVLPDGMPLVTDKFEAEKFSIQHGPDPDSILRAVTLVKENLTTERTAQMSADAVIGRMMQVQQQAMAQQQAQQAMQRVSHPSSRR